MPRRLQDSPCSCDINIPITKPGVIPTTMPGAPIAIDSAENVRLKILENRTVPKNTSYLDKPKEFDDFKEDDYIYVSNDNGELRKFPIKNITAEKALDYTEAYSLVFEGASKPLIGVEIDSLEAGKFNRLPIRNNESFHLYIYSVEEYSGNRTTTGAFACTAETINITEPIYDPTAHVSAVITSAVSLGDDFESITINEHRAPIINGNIPISIKFNGTEFATNTINNKLTTEFTATINDKEIPVDNKATAKIGVKINGDNVLMSDAEPGVINLDVDTRINKAVKVEETRAKEEEAALAAAIKAEETRAQAAEKTNADNIIAEVLRAEAAEQANVTAIETEKTRAMAAEKSNSDAIASEVATARAAEANLQNQIIDINKKIPEAATESNKLADKDFVNSSISTNTADFRGTYDAYKDLKIDPNIILEANSLIDEKLAQYYEAVCASLNSYSGLGSAATIKELEDANNNDYVFVSLPELTEYPTGSYEAASAIQYDRFKFTASIDAQTGTQIVAEWKHEYKLNNSGFTSDQWKAINSGVTEEIRENAVNDHNLIHGYAADGSILTKDANGNTVWEPLITEIPCIKGEEKASNTMAPTAKAVVDYVENHFVDHLDSSISAADGYYLKKIVIENGVLQPIGAGETNSQAIAFDDRSKLEENVATATNVPSTLAVLEKFNSNGFIVCDEADKMSQYRSKRYNNCYIKYTGVEEAGYVPGDIYLVTATSDKDPDDWGVTNNNFNTNRDTLQNEYKTLISNDVVGYGEINLNIKDTLLRLGNKTSGATVAAGLASKTIAKCTNTAHASSYGKYLVDEDVSLTSRWTGTSNTKGNFAHIDPNGDPKWIYDTYNAEGELLGIAINAGTGAASVASMSANENTVDSYTDNTTADTNFDQIRSVNYGIHTLTFDTDTVSAEFKADVRAYALGRLDKVDDGSLETANQNNSIASLWIRYRNTSNQEIYQRIIKASTKLTFTGTGWIQSKSSNAIILAHKKNDSEDTIELPLADVKVSDDNTKSIDIIETVEAYKLLEGYTKTLTAHNALYYYAFGAFTNLQVLAKNKSAQIERLTMKPSEIESKLDSAVNSCNVRINSLETTFDSAIAGCNARINSLDTTVNGSEGIDGIVAKIPTAASASNQLADKAFVNSSLNSIAAYFITKNATGDSFATKAELTSATTFYSGGAVRVPTRNDYCIVAKDEDHDNATTRYIYNNNWEYQYTINETPLTAEQLAAINSGITADLVTEFSNKQTALNQTQLDAVNSGITASLVNNFSNKQNALTTSQLEAVNSGITAEKVAKIHDIPTDYLTSAAITNDKLIITTNKNETKEFEGGKIDTITVNGVTKSPINKNIDISIPKAPVQSVSLDSIKIDPSELDGNVNIVLADKYINKTEVSAPTVENIKSKVGTEIGNVITKSDYIEETTYEEFTG